MKMTIGQRVKIVRKHFGLKHYEFSKQLDEREGRVKSIEYEKQRAPGDFLAKVVEVFDIDALWLLTGKGDMHNKNSNITQKIKRKVLVANQRQARIVAFIDFLIDEKPEDDLIWFEGQIKRSVPDYNEFISSKYIDEKLQKKQA